MTSLIKRKMKKWKITLALRIDPPEDDDFEVMHQIEEPCDNGLDPCQDHHFQRMILPQETDRTPENSMELMQQAMQRLLAAYNQCVHRVAQTDDRMEQFRSNLRRDALELAP